MQQTRDHLSVNGQCGFCRSSTICHAVVEYETVRSAQRMLEMLFFVAQGVAGCEQVGEIGNRHDLVEHELELCNSTSNACTSHHIVTSRTLQHSLDGPVAESIRFVPDITHKDMRPSSGQLWTVKMISSIGGCAIECYKDKECTSFFYGKKEKTCLGFAYNTIPELSELVHEKGWSYFHDATLASGNEDGVSESLSEITSDGSTVTTALILYTPATIFTSEDADGYFAPRNLVTEPVPKEGQIEQSGCGGKEWKSFEKSCYKFSGSTATWDSASGRCKKRGGYLVEITSPEEDTFIAELMSQPGNDQKTWIGANDKENEGDWRWVESNNKVEYENWKRGEPNNHGLLFSTGLFAENCAHIQLRSKQLKTKWNDSKCFWKLHFICERANYLDGGFDGPWGAEAACATTIEYPSLFVRKLDTGISSDTDHPPPCGVRGTIVHVSSFMS
ncbi:hypothetical protein ScPMuIL_002825 [Solemya velum]